jgi:hypothetical protein
MLHLLRSSFGRLSPTAKGDIHFAYKDSKSQEVRSDTTATGDVKYAYKDSKSQDVESFVSCSPIDS